MKARLVRIGKSRGVRLPKIQAIRRPRAGWAEAARRMRERGEDGLLDAPSRTRFDKKEWA